MPTYQYVCGACEAPLEIVQSFSDDALVDCPACGAPELRKVYGSVGVVFKGSGFYRTDSRSASTSATPATTSVTPAATPSTDKATPASSSTPSSSTPTSN
ncbi:MAG: FmdB family transcriptional regulator [Actinobacteria bacterium]|nr:FmdB family transcriptional regulator [Actinomycetota bacterium]